MQATTFGDVLTFEIASRDQLTSNDPTLLCDETNLVIKGLTLFRNKTRARFPLKIFIEKNIPTQSGLGGGSSNLATTLWALNELSGRLARVDQLKKWAAAISSDAPFFFSKGTAYCRGRGEKVDSLPSLAIEKFYLVTSPIRMSTPLVYKKCKPHASSKQAPLDLLREGRFVNDLEPSSFSLSPALERLKKGLLSLGFKTALMSGTGSSFFCLNDIENRREFSFQTCGEYIEKNTGIRGVEFFPIAPLNREENNWYNIAHLS